MTADIVSLFPKRKPSEITVEVDPLTYWGLRNDVISEEFCKYNAYEKQEILDIILNMNLELYTMIIELKGKKH